jgi:hypothetical protein
MTAQAKTKTAPKTRSAAPAQSVNAVPARKPYIVFGADEHAKPRGATFWNGDPAALAKAVDSLCLRMCEPTTPELKRLAKLLPPGKVEATGPGFLPFIDGDLYMDLVGETVGDQQPAPAQSGNTRPLPRNWDELSAGHLVIVQESLECGWWEAIVVERKGDLLTLKYRDYPTYPKLVRHRSAVALISPPSK